MLGILVARQARHCNERSGQDAPRCERVIGAAQGPELWGSGRGGAGSWTFLEAVSFRKAPDGKVVASVLLQLYKVGPAGHVDQFLRKRRLGALVARDVHDLIQKVARVAGADRLVGLDIVLVEQVAQAVFVERDLAQLIFALRLFDSDVGLILSTREEARFRDGMLGLGPTRFSAGSCTAPGGYSQPEASGEQFAIGDHRTIDEVCRAIQAKGYDPVRKDWDATFQLVADSRQAA